MTLTPFAIWPPEQAVNPPQPSAALLVARTVYVSAAGLDTNNGTIGQPFRTLARAWQERQKFLFLRAMFTVQLVGTGPFEWSAMGMSVCVGPDGYFAILGQSETIVTSGTATGDLSTTTNIVPTTALAVADDALVNLFLRFTSGNLAGAEFLITANLAASITVGNRQARNTLGAVVNGDAFQVVQYTAVINVSTPATNGSSDELTNWIGAQNQQNAAPRHVIAKCTFTGTPLRVNDAEVSFVAVHAVNPQVRGTSRVFCGFWPNGGLIGMGLSTKGNLQVGAGCGFGFLDVNAGALLFGVFGINAGVSAQFSSNGNPSACGWAGGYHRGTLLTISGFATLTDNGGADMRRVFGGGGILLDGGARATIGSGINTFAIATGNCWSVRRTSSLFVNTAVITGGTTDAAGFGYDARTGGRVTFRAVAPQLTGGTAGADLRTTAATAANAALAAAPSFVQTAADESIGELLCRIG